MISTPSPYIVHGFSNLPTNFLLGTKLVLLVPHQWVFLATLPMQMKLSGLEEVCKGKDEILAAKQQEITGNKRALSDERQRMSSLIDECATLKGKLHGKTEEITSLRAHNRSLEEHVKVVEVWQNICKGWKMCRL